MLLDDLDVPIVLAPLAGGPSTPELAAAVTGAGGLGTLAAGYLSPDTLAARLARLGELTAGPVGVNLFAAGGPAADPAATRPYLARLHTWAESRGLALGEPRHDDDALAAKLELVLEAAPAMVSFTFGCPDPASVERLHGAGIEVWVTVTGPEEGRLAAAAGADVLIAQGAEAGGHRGSFVDDPAHPPLGLLALLQLLTAETDRPLVASGAIMTGAALAAVLRAGARAGQLGSAFLACPEAGTPSVHREALLAGEQPTALTRAFTGRLARGIVNAFLETFSDGAPVAYPEIHHVTAPLRAAARERGDASLVNLWAGEAYRLLRAEPAGAVVARLGAEMAAAAPAATAPADPAPADPAPAAADAPAAPLPRAQLEQLAREWFAAWNAHDLDAVLAHYREDVVFCSPIIAALGVSPDGVLRGHAALRAYWERALARYPDLHFVPETTYFAPRSLTLGYRAVAGLRAAEVMELDAEGRVVRATAHYDGEVGA